jgi:WD40 repeat-containing protein SMU1
LSLCSVIRLILQFLKENSLINTLKTLQEESQVYLNVVDSPQSLSNDIINGNWDSVLKNLSTLQIPVEKLFDLYEHILIEMVELKELDTARAILRQSNPLIKMKTEQPERWNKLEKVISRTYFDPVQV